MVIEQILNIYTVFGNTRAKEFIEYTLSMGNRTDVLTFLKAALAM